MNQSIKSKVSLLQASVHLLCMVGLFGVVGVLLLYVLIKNVMQEQTIELAHVLVPLGFLFISSYSLYYWLSISPRITIDKYGILFKNIVKGQQYLWQDVEHIELTGKQYLRFLFISMPVEATTVHLKNGKQVVLYADIYQNISRLRIILERANNIIKERKSVFTQLDFSLSAPRVAMGKATSKQVNCYQGNHFTSFNGIMFYGWLVFISFLILNDPTPFLSNIAPLFIFGLSTLMICGMVSYQLHYFILIDEYLIIRNHIWFWRKKVYPLSEIREIVIETPHKLSTSIRIITRDFQSKLYPAGSLRDKTWRHFKTKLRRSKIKVRNEI